MRKELELIEQIENYLMNKLSGTDKTAFEAKISADSGLKSEVEFQQNLVEGIQRLGLKKDAVNARKKYRTQRFLKTAGIIIAVISLLAGAFYYYAAHTEGGFNFFGNNNRSGETKGEVIIEDFQPILIDENDTLSSDANAFLDQELFQINADRDTVIESEEGIVVYIPANAFETENNQVDFLIQEALTPADILYAGLNTMTADGEELETGGMFYFDAFANGERIPLKKELTVDIPANMDKTGMQLYDGIENEDGELLWTNPKPITKPLIPVEITELDFYPRGYEPKMEEWGYLNKQFKDSLYYSFADECGGNNSSEQASNDNEWHSDDEIGIGEKMFNSLCASCHFVNRDMTGPALKGSKERWIKNSSEENFYAFIKNSGAVIASGDVYANKLFNDWNMTGMPSENLKNREIDWIYTYIESVNDPQVNVNANQTTLKNVDAQVSTISPVGIFMALPPQDEDTSGDLIEAVDSMILDDLLDDPCTECGVNPASVKTIWNSKFNNTNLATKEFEERMLHIHKTCNNAILELYINNLDKNLCTVDSMAMRMLGGSNRRVFANFAAKGHGQVQITTIAQQKLNDYYALKKQALQTAITKTNANYWEEQNRLDAEFTREEQRTVNRDKKSKRALDKKELEFNTNDVYAQLGLQKPVPRSTRPVAFNSRSNLGISEVAMDAPIIEIPTTPIRPSRPFLRANINSTGWKNVDCLMSVSTQREDAKIRGYNGKTASVNYSKMTVTVNDAASFNRVNVYAIPTRFNSYVKLKSKQNNFDYQLNDKLDYSVIAIAWNDQGMFYTQIEGKPGVTALDLLPVTEIEWKTKIKESLGRINNMTDEIDFIEYTKKDLDRRNTSSAKRNLRNKARAYVFPCKCSGANDQIEIIDEEAEPLIFNTDNVSAVVTQSLQEEPSFKGGYAKMNEFIANNLRFPANLAPNEIGTVYVRFRVNENGKIIQPSIAQGLTDRINSEVIRVVSAMPNWEPAISNGQPVSVPMTIPIRIREE